MANSINDTIYQSMAGNDSIMDKERRRLLALLVLSEPQALSLDDLYRLAGERPRLY